MDGQATAWLQTTWQTEKQLLNTNQVIRKTVSHVEHLIYMTDREHYTYSSFVPYRTWFSQVFSFIIQLRQKCSRQSCVTLYIFVIRYYIQLSLLIRSIVCLCTPKNPDIFTPFITWKNSSEKIWFFFSGVQRHNYCSDFKLSLYVVTYYKVTSLFRIFFYF